MSLSPLSLALVHEGLMRARTLAPEHIQSMAGGGNLGTDSSIARSDEARGQRGEIRTHEAHQLDYHR